MKTWAQTGLFASGLLMSLSASLCAMAADPVPLTQDEAVQLVKGKRLNTVNARFGNVSLDLREDGRLYGNNQGQSDSGQWKIQDGKLCLSWRRWEYEGCGTLQKRSTTVEHLYPNGSLHFSITVE